MLRSSIYFTQSACVWRRGLCVIAHLWLILILTIASATAEAWTEPCDFVTRGDDLRSTFHDGDSLDSDADEPGSLRQKAALFAPEIHLSIWYRTQADARAQARSLALTATPTPHQFNAQEQAPFGWQVSLRWNLVDMAEAFLPLFEESQELSASRECPQFHNIDDLNDLQRMPSAAALLLGDADAEEVFE